MKKELEFEKFDNFIVLGEKNDKLKKVIEILKDKRVDLDIFMNCKTLEEYNNAIEYTYKSISENYKLTPQEYDLLKEVLSND